MIEQWWKPPAYRDETTGQPGSSAPKNDDASVPSTTNNHGMWAPAQQTDTKGSTDESIARTGGAQTEETEPATSTADVAKITPSPTTTDPEEDTSEPLSSPIDFDSLAKDYANRSRAASNPRQQVSSCQGGLLFAIQPQNPGETFYSISRIFNMSVQSLIAANPSANPRNLQTGQIICVPGAAEQVCHRGQLYIVQPGETLYTIAGKFDVPFALLLEANAFLPNPNLIFPGQQVCIPATLNTPCCVLLEGADKLSGNPGGSVRIDHANSNFRLTFAAAGLPDPASFGDFDTYAGDLIFRETDVLVPLQRVQPEVGGVVAWAGAEITDLSPLGANLLAIVPYNTETGEFGPFVLTGSPLECMGASGQR